MTRPLESEHPRAELRPGDANQLSRHLIALATTIRVRVSDGLIERGHVLSPSTTQLIPNLPVAGLGMSELAARLRLTLQRTGQLVQRLEEDGYVERVPDESDGRAKRVVYTKRGRKLVADIDDILGELSEQFAAVLGKRGFERLCGQLGDLDHAVNREDAPLRVVGRR